jgi:hypothetical protein
MGADRLDSQLAPIAEFLLIIIALLVVASVTAYFLSKAVQRRKERAHGKLSGSRRTKHSKIDLFAKQEETGRTSRGSGRSRRSSSGESRVDILKRPSDSKGGED